MDSVLSKCLDSNLVSHYQFWSLFTHTNLFSVNFLFVHSFILKKLCKVFAIIFPIFTKQMLKRPEGFASVLTKKKQISHAPTLQKTGNSPIIV